MTSKSKSEYLPIWVKTEEDGSMTICWDENHQTTSILNSWTKDDFVNIIEDAIGDPRSK
jgi:hypothetical protein